jgi:peptidoglycan/xylan/chitin deacetylase (PgdA/CDA1 family)
VKHANTGSINSGFVSTYHMDEERPWPGEEVYVAATEHAVPILMYHSICDERSSHPAGHYRITRAGFEEQLISLRREGFQSISMSGLPIPEKRGALSVGNPIILTFDDGYKDFIQNALPLLDKHGFTASLYIPTHYLGRASEWDSRFGSCFELLDAHDLRVLSEWGIEVGSHSETHPFMAAIPPHSMLLEAKRSKEVLEAVLGKPVNQFSYPFGSVNDSVTAAIGEAGYTYAVTVEERKCGAHEDRLRLPRLHVTADIDIRQFMRMVLPVLPNENVSPKEREA